MSGVCGRAGSQESIVWSLTQYFCKRLFLLLKHVNSCSANNFTSFICKILIYMRRVSAFVVSFGQEQIGVMMKNFDSFHFPATTRRYADFYLIFCTRSCDIIIYTGLC